MHSFAGSYFDDAGLPVKNGANDDPTENQDRNDDQKDFL